MRRLCARTLSLLAGASLSVAAPCWAQPAEEGRVVIAPQQTADVVNPAGRAVVLTLPVMDGEAYIGDVTATLEADGRTVFSAARLLALLAPRLVPAQARALETALAQDGELTADDLAAGGVGIAYDPQALEITLEIAAGSRPASVIDLGSAGRRAVAYMEPADFSAYLNLRGAMDWVEQGDDEGLSAPAMFIDGAVRWKGVVLESEFDWQPGAATAEFQRRGARLVYDDRERLLRWAAGDLQPIARGFQSAPEIAGLSLSRRYSLLDPQTITRPRGNRSFRLDRRSMVEVRINGQLVRRIELDPGSYDLQDFPFSQGANDVELIVTDDAGRTERLDFNIFLEQSQLAEGLSEFGLYAGVLAPLGLSGPVYSDTPAVTGFYRRGLSDRLTLGANFQADTHNWMGGGELVAATPFGSLAGLASVSQIEGVGRGWAGLLTFQRTFARRDLSADVFSLSLEARSRDFGPVGVRDPANPYSLIASASYGRSLTDTFYAGLDARYSKGRGEEPDVTGIRGIFSWTISPTLSFNGDVSYERDRQGSRIGALLSLTYRFSRNSSVRADYDSRYDRARLSYQTYRGSGIGAYSLNADVEHSDLGIGASFNGTYYGNRAEIGLSHYGVFDEGFSASAGQRTSLRFGTALAFADGVATIGRPVQDSFALVQAHRSLREAEVLVDPIDDSASASTGSLGTALQPALSSYSDRSIFVTAPEAPIALDLGAGSFRLFPPYRGGYLLVVGSDYNASVFGRLLTAAGAPLSLMSGTATELAHPEREPVPLFTNRDGRFAVTGLAPGCWELKMADSAAGAYRIEVPEETSLARLGDVSPISADSAGGCS